MTAFRGRRDGYEVPVALAEAGLLDAFLTDLLAGRAERLVARALPARAAETLRGRGDPRLPSDRVRSLRGLALRERLFRGTADDRYARFDPEYGLAAARLARRRRSDLLLYSPYAEPAFTARYAHTPRKLLFQYHPHIALERRLIEADLGRGDHPPAPPPRIASDDVWKLADHIVCASGFTRRSLVEQGAASETISIIPYGVDLPPLAPPPAGDRFHALFVGSGFRRKGLHHLLAAWRAARLPKGSVLTVVARVIEPELLALVRSTPGVDYRPGVARAELATLYASATLFVMPSLVEGFGQVYLEALAHGLPVLGTAHTCVPDLGGAGEGLFLTEPGQSEALAAELEALARTLPGDAALRDRARAVAERNDWATFRRRIAALAAAR